MNNLVTTSQPRQGGLILTTMADYLQMGEIMVASGLANKKSAAAAAGLLIVGHELGLTSWEALRHLYLVNGKPEVSAELMAGRIKSSGRYNYSILEHTDQACVIEFMEGKNPLGQSSFTMADARTAGLLSNPTWEKYPRNMLWARALSNGRRWFCPEVLNGTYVQGEIESDDMKTVEAVPTMPAETAPAEPEAALTLPTDPELVGEIRILMENKDKELILSMLGEAEEQFTIPRGSDGKRLKPEHWGDEAVQWCILWMQMQQDRGE